MKAAVQKNARKRGNRGEDAVCRYLRLRGWRILERNFTVKGGEIDLIAESEDTLVFVEVKGRTDGDQIRRFGRPSAAINAAKTFSDLLNTDLVRSRVAAAAGYPGFNGELSVKVQEGTNLLDVSLTAPTAKQAYAVL